MGGKTGARGDSRGALHVLFSVSLATFAFCYFSAGLMELLRPLGPSLSACLAVVSDYLDDRRFMFLFCTALLVLVAGDSRVVTSSGPGIHAGFMGDDVISVGGYVWLAPGTLDGGAGALGGRTGLPGVGLPETIAVEGEERADELEEEVEEVLEEDGEGRRDEQQQEEGEEEEGRKEEEQEGQEGEEEVDGEEFRRKCEDFIEKVKRERVKEALHLILA